MATVYGKELVLFILVIFVSFVSADNDENANRISTYFMYNFCHGVFNMSKRGLTEMMLELTDTNSYSNNMDCVMTIATSADHVLFINFQWVKLASCDDWVRLYGKSNASVNVISRELCVENSDVYTTNGSTAILKFHSDALFNSGGFKILLTTFYIPVNGKCKAGYFKCEIQRCIPENLFCNSRDNCGDNSDEYEDCDEDLIWLYILLGVLGFVIICVIVLLYCLVCRHKRKRKKGQVHDVKMGYPPATTAHQTKITSQGYSSPTASVSTTTDHTGPVAVAAFTAHSNVGEPYLGVPPPAIYIPPCKEKF